MTEKTLQQLLQLNKDFYSKNAESFSSTRQYYWRGWEKAWKEILKINPHPKQILDAGCGNGRFLDFLQDRHSSFDYLGIDNSLELIQTRESGKQEKIAMNSNLLKDNSINFQVVDLSRNFVLSKKFDLITTIAVFHHIPTRQLRLNLLNNLQKSLTKNGVLLITFWEFLDDSSLNKKIIPWEKINLKSEDVEEHDYLLDWKGDSNNLRYCHYFSLSEKEWLVKNSQTKLVTSFRSDGRNGELNTYFLLKKI